jgi:hypothetical protein
MKKPSILYWIICVLGVLWSCGGAYDYLMTRTKNADYMSEFPPELIDYFYNMPLLLDVTWALAVWGGLLGWLLMLLRKNWAVPAFAVSLAAMVVNFGYMAFDGGLALQGEYMGPTAHIFTALIVLLGVFGLWYARRAKASGILR